MKFKKSRTVSFCIEKSVTFALVFKNRFIVLKNGCSRRVYTAEIPEKNLLNS